MVNYKQFWFNFAKWIFIALLSWYVFHLLSTSNQIFTNVFYHLIIVWVENGFFFMILIILSIVNWLLESKKWQILVENQQPISFLNAIKQSLTSHSFSFITPFKTGDYAFKTIFFSRDKLLNVIALNGLGNLIQLFVTTLLGLLGILIITFLNPVNFPQKIIFIGLTMLLLISLLFPILFSLRNHPTIIQWKNSLNLISKNNIRKVFVLSFFRYFIFSHQYYLLVWMSNINMSYIQVISLIFIIYLISSYLNIISLFDFIIKGSVGIWLFSFFMVNNQIIFSISVGMWGLNFLFPAIVGWVILLFFKSDWLHFFKV